MSSIRDVMSTNGHQSIEIKQKVDLNIENRRNIFTECLHGSLHEICPFLVVICIAKSFPKNP